MCGIEVRLYWQFVSTMLRAGEEFIQQLTQLQHNQQFVSSLASMTQLQTVYNITNINNYTTTNNNTEKQTQTDTQQAIQIETQHAETQLTQLTLQTQPLQQQAQEVQAQQQQEQQEQPQLPQHQQIVYCVRNRIKGYPYTMFVVPLPYIESTVFERVHNSLSSTRHIHGEKSG